MRVAPKLVALAIVLAGATTACSSSSTVSTSTGPTATSAPSLGAALSAGDFAEALKRPGTVVLDVRTAEEYAAGHLPGAINIDVSGPDFAASVGALDPAASYALYCRSGNRSGVAMQAMQGMGFTNVYHLSGGINAWTAAGGDIVKG